jgi:hypothetical protein
MNIAGMWAAIRDARVRSESAQIVKELACERLALSDHTPERRQRS